MKWIRCSRWLVLLWLFATSSVGAQDAKDAKDAEARALFNAAQVAFEGGRYESALDYFRRAYTLSGRKGLLYNVGLAADRSGQQEAGVDAYESYLSAVPDAPNRALVEGRIAALRSDIASAEQNRPASEVVPVPAPVAQPSPAHEADSERRAHVLPWSLLGVGLAVTVTGAVLLGVSLRDVAKVEDAKQGSAWSDVEGSYDRSRPLSIAGITLLGVGMLASGAGLWWALRVPRTDSTLALGLGQLRVRGRF